MSVVKNSSGRFMPLKFQNIFTLCIQVMNLMSVLILLKNLKGLGKGYYDSYLYSLFSLLFSLVPNHA